MVCMVVATSNRKTCSSEDESAGSFVRYIAAYRDSWVTIFSIISEHGLLYSRTGYLLEHRLLLTEIWYFMKVKQPLA